MRKRVSALEVLLDGNSSFFMVMVGRLVDVQCVLGPIELLSCVDVHFVRSSLDISIDIRPLQESGARRGAPFFHIQYNGRKRHPSPPSPQQLISSL